MYYFFSFFFILLSIITPSSAHSFPDSYINQEDSSVTLYYRPSCPHCAKVIKYLNSINKQVYLRNTETDVKARQELMEKGGKPQVPCLIIDEKALYESDRIVEWLSEHQESLEEANS